MLLTSLLVAGVGARSVCAMEDKDPYLWLEEVEGEAPLRWARRQNDRTLEELRAHPWFETIYERNLEVFNSDERIAYPSQTGGFLYNFWRDADAVRGLWRRTTVEEYRKTAPEWEGVLDLDALAKAEGENWNWGGSNSRYPDYDRTLLSTSRGGADAAVVREFDLETLRFVEGGFELPEAKSRLSWRDRESLFVGTDFGEGSLTDSGYPRVVKLWRRGTSLEEAETIFEGRPTDVSVGAYRLWDDDAFYEIVYQSTSFYTRNYFFYAEGKTLPLPLPDDARLQGVFRGQLLVELKSDWRHGGETYGRGALISAPVDRILAGGEVRFQRLFEPDERTSVSQVRRTANTILLNVLDNVVSRVWRFAYEEGRWERSPLSVPEMGAITIVSTERASDRFYYNYAGFLASDRLYEADALTDRHELIRAEPAFFDADGMTVEQHEAVSADGTKIPYFLVKPRDFEADGRNPTLLYGYGGFESSMRPGYLGSRGYAWVGRGGVYALANIRGGGEFGPRWHQAALRENRQRAFDDFIAVAEDLIERKITSPRHLGIQGGSNGGLLVGAVAVQRPDLFNAVVCRVPLLDMRRYHRLLAGASWMAEYGDPDNPDDWRYLARYSPYHNVQAGIDYPQILFTTSTRDDRVHPGHARKMVAKMRDQGHDVLYYENIEGGHGGAANLNQSAFISALIYSYLHGKLNPESEEGRHSE